MQKKRSIGHIKKLGNNKYLLRLSLGFDDFGKRIQPSKTVDCSSDREAERLLYEFYNEREKLKVQQTSFVPKTLGQLYTEWQTHHIKEQLRAKTAEWYSTLWNTHIKYASELKLEKLSPAHIHKIIDNIESVRAKNAVYKLLKSMFNKAIKWGYMEANPCNKMDTPKYSAPEKKVLTEEQINTIQKTIINEDIKYQVIYYFAILCSMRRQEIIGLKWSDIDFIEDKIKITRAATQLDGMGTITDKTKTQKSARTLFLPDILKKLLLQLYNQQKAAQKKWGDKWIDEDWVFTQANGSLMCLATPSHWWKEFAKQNGIEEVTFHGLRHTAATYMIKSNVPISTVSGVLGHAQISTTLNTYTHVIEDTKKTAINIMADIVAKPISDETTETSEAI